MVKIIVSLKNKLEGVSSQHLIFLLLDQFIDMKNRNILKMSRNWIIREFRPTPNRLREIRRIWRPYKQHKNWENWI